MPTVNRLIAASPAAAWDILVDLDAWPVWGPTVRGARLDHPYRELALHATGTVQTALWVSVPFVVSEFEPGRHWAWQVAGIPATGHRVEPVGEHARVSIAVPWWAGPYLTVCAMALRRIETMLTA